MRRVDRGVRLRSAVLYHKDGVVGKRTPGQLLTAIRILLIPTYFFKPPCPRRQSEFSSSMQSTNIITKLNINPPSKCQPSSPVRPVPSPPIRSPPLLSSHPSTLPLTLHSPELALDTSFLAAYGRVGLKFYSTYTDYAIRQLETQAWRDGKIKEIEELRDKNIRRHDIRRRRIEMDEKRFEREKKEGGGR